MIDEHRGPEGRGPGRTPSAAPSRRGRAPSSARRSCATWATSGSAASAVRCRTSSPAWRPSCCSWPSARATVVGWLAVVAARGVVPLLHLDDPRQLVRRRRHRRQPLLPEPAAARDLPRAPRRRDRGWPRPASSGWPSSLGPILAAPLMHSLRPGHHALAAPFRALPAELTMLNDLAVFAERWRKKQAVRRHRGRPAQALARRPEGVLPLLSRRRHVREGDCARARRASGCAAGASAEVFLRALEPMTSAHVRFVGGRSGDDVTVRLGGTQRRGVGRARCCRPKRRSRPGRRSSTRTASSTCCASARVARRPGPTRPAARPVSS